MKKKRSVRSRRAGSTDRRASALSVSGARRTSTARKTRRGGEMLPEELRPFFWDVEFDKLRWSEYRDFIITRVLSRGDWHSVIGLRSRVGDKVVREAVEKTSGRDLSPEQLWLWQNILEIPKPLVNHWLAHPKRRIWDQRCGTA